MSAKAPIFSSRALAGSHFYRWAGEPSIAIDCMAKPEWTPKKVLTLPSPRESSMPTRPTATGDIPGQP